MTRRGLNKEKNLLNHFHNVLCLSEVKRKDINMILHNLEDIQWNSPPQCAKDYVPKRSIWNSYEMMMASCIYTVLTMYCNIFYYVNMNIYRFVENGCFILVGTVLGSACIYFIVKSFVEINSFNKIVENGMIVRCRRDKSRDEKVYGLSRYFRIKVCCFYCLGNERYTFFHTSKLVAYGQVNRAGEVTHFDDLLVIFRKGNYKKYYVCYEEAMLYSRNEVNLPFNDYTRRFFVCCTVINIVLGIIWIVTGI